MYLIENGICNESLGWTIQAFNLMYLLLLTDGISFVLILIVKVVDLDWPCYDSETRTQQKNLLVLELHTGLGRH